MGCNTMKFGGSQMIHKTLAFIFRPEQKPAGAGGKLSCLLPLVSCLPYYSALKTEVVSPYEMLGSLQISWRYNL